MNNKRDNIAAPGTFLLEGSITRPSTLRWPGLIAIGLLAVFGLWTLHAFLPALGWAGIFAVSLWPWYSRFCAAWPRHRGLTLPGVTTLLVLLAFVVPLILVIGALAHDSAAVAQWIGRASTNGVAPPPMLADLPYGDHLMAWWQSELGPNGAIRQVSMQRVGMGWLPVGAEGRFLGAVAHRLLLIIFMLLSLFFVLREGDRVALGLNIAIKRIFGEVGERVGKQVIGAVRATVNGLVVVGFAEGLILGIAYGLAGVPHPALFGLLTAILSAIPLGSVIAYLAAAATLAANDMVGAAVFIVVFGSVIVFIADHFVRPYFIGEATRLPFLWVLLGILGGIESWGLIGLILGPALVSALFLLWREWVGALPGPLNPVRSDVLD